MSTSFHPRRILGLAAGLLLGAGLYSNATPVPTHTEAESVALAATPPALDREAAGVKFETATLACG